MKNGRLNQSTGRSLQNRPGGLSESTAAAPNTLGPGSLAPGYQVILTPNRMTRGETMLLTRLAFVGVEPTPLVALNVYWFRRCDSTVLALPRLNTSMLGIRRIDAPNANAFSTFMSSRKRFGRRVSPSGSSSTFTSSTPPPRLVMLTDCGNGYPWRYCMFAPRLISHGNV